MTFENTARFVEWLDRIFNRPYSLDAVLYDVAEQYRTSGSLHYEEEAQNTKSGNPECYHFDVLETYDEENDSWNTTIVF